MIAMMAPKTERNQKTSGQGPASRSQPPMIGAMAGPMPKIIAMVLISRWARAPSKRSRTTVRETIVPAPADIPCRTRKARRTGSEGERAHPIEARA